MEKDEYAKSAGIWCGLNRPDLSESEPDEIGFLADHKVNMKTAKQIYAEGIKSVAADVCDKMKRFSNVYVTVDIDGLDPAYAAGTGTPQFGGLTAPELDPSLASMFAARKIITECWGYHIAAR